MSLTVKKGKEAHQSYRFVFLHSLQQLIRLPFRGAADE